MPRVLLALAFAALLAIPPVDRANATSFAQEYVQLRRVCLDFSFGYESSPLDRDQTRNAIRNRLADFVTQRFAQEDFPYTVTRQGIEHCYDQPPRTLTLQFEATLQSDAGNADSKIGAIRVIGRFNNLYREAESLAGFHFGVQLFRCTDALEPCVNRELERYFNERLIPLLINGRTVGRR